jgi:hypothetical protein
LAFFFSSLVSCSGLKAGLGFGLRVFRLFGLGLGLGLGLEWGWGQGSGWSWGQAQGWGRGEGWGKATLLGGEGVGLWLGGELLEERSPHGVQLRVRARGRLLRG